MGIGRGQSWLVKRTYHATFLFNMFLTLDALRYACQGRVGGKEGKGNLMIEEIEKLICLA
jgi:hypothetical protein